MGIGYGRAARLIDFMAEDGYVGPYNGSKAREVMMTEDQWANIQAGDPNPVNDEDWVEETPEAEDKKVELKPKKLERIEPGQTSILAANVSFSPKRKKKPVEEIPEEEEEEVEFEVVDEMDSEDDHDDEAYEDEEYDDIDYEEDEEEEEYEEYEEDDEDYEDVDD